MKTFREITEIMDSGYKFRKLPDAADSNDSTHTRYSFKSPNDKYTVYMSHPENGHSEMKFSGQKAGMQISNAEGNQSHKVFSTVMKIAKQHVDKNNINVLHFDAFKDQKSPNDDSSRSRLYDALVKRHAKNSQTFDCDNFKHYAIKLKNNDNDGS